MSSNVLRVGTDCSGIEAPIEALLQLKIPFRHVFSSEIDKFCIQSIKANYSPEILFGDKEGPFPDGDITKRNVSDIPDIDLYVCGFPCQSFSVAGNREGFAGKSGSVFFSCMEVIKHKKPRYFILENVKGLLNHDNKKTWDVIWEKVSDMTDYGYFVDWRLLNTKDYGVPQSRERVYIIGMINSPITWPMETTLLPLSEYVSKKPYREQSVKFDRLEERLDKMENKPLFVDLNFCRPNDTYRNAHLWSPCLNIKNGLWCLPEHRFATSEEKLKLQGFREEKFVKVVSKTQLHKQIGNSMSVNVLKCILVETLKLC